MILWKNIVEPERPQTTIWRMRIACWIPKTTDTHSKFAIHCFSSATTVARTLLKVTLNVLSYLIMMLLQQYDSKKA
jgi:hypothetical protein